MGEEELNDLKKQLKKLVEEIKEIKPEIKNNGLDQINSDMQYTNKN